jgi:excisionase family DNA binding protein
MEEEGIRGDDRPHPRHRLTVAQAADVLNVSVDAVRARIKRETIEHVREGRRVYVLLDANQVSSSHAQGGDQDRAQAGARTDAQAELVESLIEQVSYMREQLAEEREARRRADTIIAQLSQANAALASRVPELEAPASPEAKGDPVAASEESGRGTTLGEQQKAPSEAQERKRSWWREFFGLE